MGICDHTTHSNAIKYSSHQVFKGVNSTHFHVIPAHSYQKRQKNANERPLFDLMDKNQIRQILFLRIAIVHISIRHQLNPIKLYDKFAKV